VSTWLADFTSSIRQLSKNPGFALATICALALGSGPNTAIFSVVSGFLRPLPVAEPTRLIALAMAQKDDQLSSGYFSYPELLDIQQQTTAFSDVFAYSLSFVALKYGDRSDQLVISFVTGNFFSALGLRAADGRLFLPSEDSQSASLIVLSYSYWQRRFDGDPGIIGKQVLINGRPEMVVGIAPKGFHGVYSIVDMDAYILLNQLGPIFKMSPSDIIAMKTNRLARSLTLLGRLKPGLTLYSAQTSLNVVTARLAKQYSESEKNVTMRAYYETHARPAPLAADTLPVITSAFLGLGLLVLALACVNVASLLLLRGRVRAREIAIRAALGASRWRLIRQSLTESNLLAFFGGALGLVLGKLALFAVRAFHPTLAAIPVRFDFRIDLGVFTYALLCAIATGTLAGIIPALRSSSLPLAPQLNEGGRADSGNRGRNRTLWSLAALQLSCSLVLLIAAGLFLYNARSVQQIQFDFDPGNVASMIMDPGQLGYDETRGTTFYRELERRIRTIPGVKSVGTGFSIPMSGFFYGALVYVEGHPLPPGTQPPLVRANPVDPGYLEAMRLVLLRGRGFVESDNKTAPAVALVNETMAKKFWPNENAIGKRFKKDDTTGPFIQVVGIVRDGKYQFIAEKPLPYFYVPISQNYTSWRTLVVRSSTLPESIISAVRQQEHDLAPDVPVFGVATMQQSLSGVNGFFFFRLGAALAIVMGMIGICLAAIGVYGVVSYAASQRTREIGIRMALGAQPSKIVQLVLLRALTVMVFGVVVGLTAALAITRTMGALFVNTSATDPLIFTGSVIVLALATLGACIAPAYRSIRLAPLSAMQSD